MLVVIRTIEQHSVLMSYCICLNFKQSKLIGILKNQQQNLSNYLLLNYFRAG